MINKPIETYNDLVRAKNTYDFAANYPDMDNGTLNFIYDFSDTIGAKVVGNENQILFYVNAKLVKTIDMKMSEGAARYYSTVQIVDRRYYATFKISSPSSSSGVAAGAAVASYSSYSSRDDSSYSSGRSSNNNNN
ncbi:MAG: hypothetical protein IKB95_05135, partial [Bacteroidales bacterium]|nr:hypothetical protein [Bacteroidales bacterium]MBR2887589.1 hypothetical protein [Bacteroidales bacterium]